VHGNAVRVLTHKGRYGSLLSWLPVLAWMTVLFYLSSRPSTPSLLAFPHADKLAHAIAFGILGGLLAFARLPVALGSVGRVGLVTLLVAAYGLSDEFHQSFVEGRDSSAWDLLADTFGGLGAALAVMWWQRRRATRR